MKEVEAHVNCDDRTIKMASRVRRDADPAIWKLVVIGQATVGDAEALVRGLQDRFKGQRHLQQVHQQVAAKRLESGAIKYLRHYVTGRFSNSINA